MRSSTPRRPFPFLTRSSWDRTAYNNDLRGYNSSMKLTDTFLSNFIIANYGSSRARAARDEP